MKKKQLKRPDHRKKIIEDLSVSADLQKEFKRQPSIIARWGFLEANANSNVRKYDERVELVFSKLYQRYRDKNPGAKENDCKSYIRRHQEYKDVMRELRNSKYQRDILRVAMKSLDSRSSMLMQLGAHYRSELIATDKRLRRTAEGSLEEKSKAVTDMLQNKFNEEFEDGY